MSAVDGALHDPIERALRPLDRARTWLLRTTMPVSSYFAGAREPRVLLVGISVVALSLLGAVLAPLWLLALGPILIGVPHILADLRYCVVRTQLHRQRHLALLAVPVLVALSFGAPLELGFVGVAACVLALRETVSPIRRGAIVAVALGLAGLARWFGPSADLFLAHAHNFIAVGLWAVWRPREGRSHLWVLLAFLLASVALLAGAADFTWQAGLSAGLPTGLSAEVHARSLAPGLGEPWALRLVLLYCFAQSVHYGVWLRLVPEEDRDRPTPRTFRASYEAVCAELGRPVVLGFALATLALAIWACVDLAAARYGYLRFVRFHGVLELGAFALILARGRRR